MAGLRSGGLDHPSVVQTTKHHQVLFKVDDRPQSTKCANGEEYRSLSFIESMDLKHSRLIPSADLQLGGAHTSVSATVAKTKGRLDSGVNVDDVIILVLAVVLRCHGLQCVHTAQSLRSATIYDAVALEHGLLSGQHVLTGRQGFFILGVADEGRRPDFVFIVPGSHPVRAIGYFVVASATEALQRATAALVLLNLGLVVLSIHLHLVLFCPSFPEGSLPLFDDSHGLLDLRLCICYQRDAFFIHTSFFQSFHGEFFSIGVVLLHLVLPVARLLETLVMVLEVLLWPLGSEFLGNPLASKVSLDSCLNQVAFRTGEIGIHQKVPTLEEVWQKFWSLMGPVLILIARPPIGLGVRSVAVGVPSLSSILKLFGLVVLILGTPVRL